MTLDRTKAPFSIKRFFKYFITVFACTERINILLYNIYQVNYEQMAHNSNSAINFYTYTLQSEMSDISTFMQKLCYADNSFQLLTMKSLKDTDKVLLQYNLTEMLKRHVAPYESIFVYNQDDSISMYASGSSFSSNGSQYIYQLKNNVKEYWSQQDSSQFNTWIAFQDEHHSVLMKTLKVKDIFVCTTIDLNKFDLMNDSNSDDIFYSYGFFDNDKILSNTDYIHNMGITIGDLNKSMTKPIFSNYYVKTSPIEETDINLYCILKSDYLWLFTRLFLFIFILITLITCGIIVYIFYSFNNILLYPIDQINAATKHLDQNDSSTFLANSNSNIIEYQNINNSLAKLIRSKDYPKYRKHSETAKKDHARLQYYYSQTRSHFFINCLKSLYNMLEFENMRKCKE